MTLSTDSVTTSAWLTSGERIVPNSSPNPTPCFLMNRLRFWAGILAFALIPAALHAQFTGVVQSPARRASVRTDSAALRARGDSARGTASQQMHAWLDSINRELGIDTVPHTEPNFFARGDSARPATPEPVQAAREDARMDTAGTRSSSPEDGGMRAPDSATSLPTVALLGAGALAVGLLLLRRRPGRRLAARARSARR